MVLTQSDEFCAVRGMGAAFDGILRSVDRGVTFTEINQGLTSLDVLCIIVMINDDGILFCVTLLSGVNRSSGNGATWEACNNGLPYNADVFAIKGGWDKDRFMPGSIRRACSGLSITEIHGRR
jgi:hypothetical protein